MKYLQNVNQQQREAIETINGPIIVVAGPGSGKTRVLTHRMVYLMSNGIPSYNILALTFTNKAANEMKERITGLIGQSANYLWMGTFHSVFARILRMECDKIGFQKNYSIYDENDSLKLIKRIMTDLHIPVQQYSPQGIRYRISQAKNSVITPDEFARNVYDLTGEQTAKIFKEYASRLKENNSMDFDDLLIKPIELFQRHKEILTAYQSRFRYLLVDEYQDTNHAQYLMLKLLAERQKNICVVGDDAQSIYAFRGADIKNILEFQKDYPDCKFIRLEQNYRSTKTILAAADSVIKFNQSQITKNLWTENEEGDRITLLQCGDDREEGQEIVTRIFVGVNNQEIHYHDVAIMYRTNAQSRSIEDALRKNGIPYVIIGGIEFYQRKEIKDVIAYFRLLVNPQDNESFLRIVNFPNRGLGDVALGHLKTYAMSTNTTFLSAAGESGKIAQLSKRAQSGFLAFNYLISKYRKLISELSISELTRALVDETGILKHLKEEETPESLARMENIHELLSAISEYADEHKDATVEGFLQEVSLVADIDQWDSKANAVTLLTLHSAKGLEFPVVFITGLEEGLLPYYNSSLESIELEEERRLFYVGITRAMKKLFLSHCMTRYRFTELSMQSPSRFITELPDNLIEKPSLRRTHFSNGIKRYGSTRKGKVDKKIGAKKEDSYFTDVQPDYEEHSDEIKNIRSGVLVHHETFGKGKIMHVVGKGEVCKVVVHFDAVGSKTLMLKYARLRLV
ncbi:MAG: UvrD-helicase domain-containing protein [Ignavibacteriales bacterium]|nr:UvrD-helicase domain-containing protein [Ignavibacteriales bacterium]